MKNAIYTILLLLFSLNASAQQWPNFLNVLDSDWHEPTELLNHRPHCWLSDVHVNEDQSDGVAYVAFGYGQIATVSCDVNPAGLIHPNFRAFTLALNANGEVVDVRTFTHEPYPCGYQRWNNGNLWSSGMTQHSYRNDQDEIVAILNNSENYGYVLNENTNQYLHIFSSSGEPTQPATLLIEGSPLHHYEMGGIAPDKVDTTYLVYGREFTRDAPYEEFTSQKAALKKFDLAGNELWSKTYPNTHYVYKLVEAETGGYWLSVHAPNTSNTCNSLSRANMVIRVDRNGNELARVTLNDVCFSSVLSLIEVEPNQLVGFGRGAITPENVGVSEPSTGHFYTCTLQYNEVNSGSSYIDYGNFKMYLPGTDADETATTLSVDDGFLMGGYHSRAFYDAESDGELWWQKRAMLFKLDENRDSVWTRFYSSIIPDVPGVWREHIITDFKPTPDGGYVCVGWMRHNNFLTLPPMLRGTHSAFALKVDEHGCLEPGCQYVGVDEMAIDLRGSLKAYPNPASHYLRVNLDLPEQAAQSGAIELVMHDLNGREVYRQNHPEVRYRETTLDVSAFKAGIYMLHCTVNGVWVDGQKVLVE